MKKGRLLMADYKKIFMDKYADYIAKVCKAHNLLPSVGIAQAILESGWGRSGLTQKGNALYGIKATSNWKGKRMVCRTFEIINNERQDGPDCFRAYDTPFQSIEDYADFLQLSRYAKLKTTKDPYTYCVYLKQAGYATATDYVESLMGIIRDNNLTKYDVAAVTQTATKPKTTTQVVVPAKPVKQYTIKKGDSWWRIANEQLGDGSRFAELAKFNDMTPATTIYPGQVIKLP